MRKISRFIIVLIFSITISLGVRTDRATTQGMEEPPFRLPFQDPPGPGTWLLGQAYGNTAGAYRQRASAYSAGQGLHFGVDLIDHPNGYASFYGHLLETPELEVGQSVLAGQVVAKVGDPDETCTSRPHLHLEIRNAGAYNRAYNPLSLIAADWDSLSLVGPFGRGFARDLNDPRRWQNLYDQPETTFWGPRLNDYAAPWPLDWNR